MNTMKEDQEFLEHFGVKGMKWGVRRQRTKADLRRRAKRQGLADNRRRLTDEDLRKHVERLSNEKKLKELVDQDLRPGKTMAKKIMSESGQRVAKTVVAGAALYGIKAALQKSFNPKEAALYVTPRPKN